MLTTAARSGRSPAQCNARIAGGASVRVCDQSPMRALTMTACVERLEVSRPRRCAAQRSRGAASWRDRGPPRPMPPRARRGSGRGTMALRAAGPPRAPRRQGPSPVPGSPAMARYVAAAASRRPGNRSASGSGHLRGLLRAAAASRRSQPKARITRVPAAPWTTQPVRIPEASPRRAPPRRLLRSRSVTPLRGVERGQTRGTRGRGGVRRPSSGCHRLRRGPQLDSDLLERERHPADKPEPRSASSVSIAKLIAARRFSCSATKRRPASICCGPTSSARRHVRRTRSRTLRDGSRYCVGLVVFGEAVLAVLADGLKQPVAGLEPAVLGDHQRAGHQPLGQLEHLVRRRPDHPARRLPPRRASSRR